MFERKINWKPVNRQSSILCDELRKRRKENKENKESFLTTQQLNISTPQQFFIREHCILGFGNHQTNGDLRLERIGKAARQGYRSRLVAKHHFLAVVIMQIMIDHFQP